MRVTLVAATIFAFVLTVASVTAARTGEAVASELPAAPGRDTLVRVCGDCHGVDLFEDQRRTRAQWRTVVEDMVSRGANASDDDTMAIVVYLATVLGRVNVNKATESDIAMVLELSASEASAIVGYRATSGEFKALDDLKNVPGLDFSKVEPKTDRITFAGQ